MAIYLKKEYIVTDAITKLPIKMLTLTDIMIRRYTSIISCYNQLLTYWGESKEVVRSIDMFGSAPIDSSVIIQLDDQKTALAIISTQLDKIRAVLLVLKRTYKFSDDKAAVMEDLAVGIDDTLEHIRNDISYRGIELEMLPTRTSTYRPYSLWSISVDNGGIVIIADTDIDLTVPKGVFIVIELPVGNIANYTILFDISLNQITLRRFINNYSRAYAMIEVDADSDGLGRLKVKKGCELGRIVLRDDIAF